ncbi:Hypothetical_protein [Hexamita inflata]|uniref:Hypothetical_protein n=1 Tax=Hexamita inflata TaxID=28002 RepID=A0AA86TFX4_9EUKA|nr:Hypothetical protein HINF_LOCUS5114 [Hexamita inflata]
MSLLSLQISLQKCPGACNSRPSPLGELQYEPKAPKLNSKTPRPNSLLAPTSCKHQIQSHTKSQTINTYWAPHSAKTNSPHFTINHTTQKYVTESQKRFNDNYHSGTIPSNFQRPLHFSTHKCPGGHNSRSRPPTSLQYAPKFTKLNSKTQRPNSNF